MTRLLYSCALVVLGSGPGLYCLDESSLSHLLYRIGMAEALDSFLSAKLSAMRSDSGGDDAIIAAEGPDFSKISHSFPVFVWVDQTAEAEAGLCSSAIFPQC